MGLCISKQEILNGAMNFSTKQNHRLFRYKGFSFLAKFTIFDSLTFLIEAMAAIFSGSIVALITPFTENGRIDIPTFERLVNWQIEEGTEGIVICGTTGESPTIEDDERDLLLISAIKTADGRVPIIMGTGFNSTEKSVLATRRAKDLGASAALIISPYYNKPSDEGVFLHYKALSDLGLPLIVYHNPARTIQKFSFDLMSQIMALDGVVALKDASCDIHFSTYFALFSEKAVFAGDDTSTIPLVSMGGVGVISVIANIIPRLWREIVDLARKGDFIAARTLYKQVLPLIRAIFCEVNPIGIKYALSLMGGCSPYYRLPMTGPSKKNCELIAAALAEISAINK